MPHLSGINITGPRRNFVHYLFTHELLCSGDDQQKKDPPLGGAHSSTAPQLPFLGQWLPNVAISTN